MENVTDFGVGEIVRFKGKYGYEPIENAVIDSKYLSAAKGDYIFVLSDVDNPKNKVSTNRKLLSVISHAS